MPGANISLTNLLALPGNLRRQQEENEYLKTNREGQQQAQAQSAELHAQDMDQFHEQEALKSGFDYGWDSPQFAHHLDNNPWIAKMGLQGARAVPQPDGSLQFRKPDGSLYMGMAQPKPPVTGQNVDLGNEPGATPAQTAGETAAPQTPFTLNRQQLGKLYENLYKPQPIDLHQGQTKVLDENTPYERTLEGADPWQLSTYREGLRATRQAAARGMTLDAQVNAFLLPMFGEDLGNGKQLTQQGVIAKQQLIRELRGLPLKEGADYSNHIFRAFGKMAPGAAPENAEQGFTDKVTAALGVGAKPAATPGTPAAPAPKPKAATSPSHGQYIADSIEGATKSSLADTLEEVKKAYPKLTPEQQHFTAVRMALQKAKQKTAWLDYPESEWADAEAILVRKLAKSQTAPKKSAQGGLAQGAGYARVNAPRKPGHGLQPRF